MGSPVHTVIASALQIAADHDLVLFIDDLATLLETSTRTIARRLRAGTFPIPALPQIDHRRRWSAVVVAQWLSRMDHPVAKQATVSASRKSLRVVSHGSQRSETPAGTHRKPRGESFRESGGPR